MPPSQHDSILRRVVDLVASGASLVTIAGEAGCGKSTLLRQVAHELSMVVVDLDGVSDSDQVGYLIGEALGVEWDAEREATHQLLSSNEATRVALDHVEDLEVSLLAELSRAFQLVVACRHRLQLSVEHVVELGPLSTDDAIVALRQHLRRRGRLEAFQDNPRYEELEKQLVAGLSCNPLAIALAAGRLGVLTVPEILDDPLVTLLSVDADAPQRHRTLEAALERSWSALSDQEQAVLAAACPMAGSFEAGVLCEAWGPEAGPVLEGLVHKSLVTAHAGRLQLVHSVRLFARKRRPSADAAEALAQVYLGRLRGWAAQIDTEVHGDARRRFAEDQKTIVGLLEQCSPAAAAEMALLGQALIANYAPITVFRDTIAALATKADELPDSLACRVLASHSHSLTRLGDPAGLELASSLVHCNMTEVWYALGWAQTEASPQEATESFERARACVDLDEQPTVAADVLWGLAYVQFNQGELERATQTCRELLQLCEAKGLVMRRLAAIGGLGIALFEQGMILQAQREVERGMALLPKGATVRQAANLAVIAVELDLEGAKQMLHDSEAWARRVGNHVFLPFCLENQATLSAVAGDLRGAGKKLDEALELYQLRRRPRREGVVRVLKAVLCSFEGDWPRARRELEISLELLLASRDRRMAAYAQLHLAVVDAHDGDAQQAYANLDEAEDRLRASNAKAHLHLAEVARAVVDWFVQPGPLELPEPHTSPARILAALAHHVERQGLAVAVEAHGLWVQAPGAERVDFSHRAPLKGVLERLVQAYRDSPGEVVPASDIVEAGWPRQKVLPESARARVYDAIRQLRKAGLSDLIVRRGNGYLIDPDGLLSVQ